MTDLTNQNNLRWRGLHVAITLPTLPELKTRGWSDADIGGLFGYLMRLALDGNAAMTLTPFNTRDDIDPQIVGHPPATP